MASQIKVQLDITDANAALDALSNKARALEEQLSSLTVSLGDKATGDPNYRSALKEYMGVQGAQSALSALQTSASVSGTTPTSEQATKAVIGGIHAGQGAFGRVIKSVGDLSGTTGIVSAIPSIAATEAQAAGAAYTPPINVADVAAAIQSSQQPSRASSPSGGGIFGPLQNLMTSRYGRALGAGLGIAGYQTFSTWANEISTGNINPTARGRTLGTLVGAGLGVLTANPILAAGMAMVGGAIGEFISAPAQREANLLASLTGGAGLFADESFSRAERVIHGHAMLSPASGEGIPGALTNSASDEVYRRSNEWAIGTAKYIHASILQGSNIRRVGEAALTASISTLAAPLMTAGFDPMGIVGDAKIPNFINFSDPSRHMPTMADSAVNYAQTLKWFKGTKGKETLAEAITRRVFERYPDDRAGAEVIQRIAPIYASLPETGGNIADVLTTFGPLGTHQFLQSNVERGSTLPMSRVQTFATAGILGMSKREIGFAGYQVRGSGTALEQAYENQMGYLSSMPDGRDSLAYAKSWAEKREATKLRQSQEDVVDYDIPMTRLEGMRSILQTLPYAPGLKFGVELQSISLMRSQLGTVQARLTGLRNSGELSEERELELTQQMWGLRTGIARSVAGLTEGIENRLPAMSAGRPAAFGRYDSIQLAAMNLYGMRHPGRSMGAVSGAHLMQQDDFVKGIVGDLDIGPRSMTEGLSGSGNTNRIERLLEQILGALQGSNSKKRPGEVSGRVWGMLSGKEVESTYGDFN